MINIKITTITLPPSTLETIEKKAETIDGAEAIIYNYLTSLNDAKGIDLFKRYVNQKKQKQNNKIKTICVLSHPSVHKIKRHYIEISETIGIY